MRKSLAVVLSFVAIAAISLFASSPRAADDAKPEERIQKWEYSWGSSEQEMVKKGRDGWEAFAVDRDTIYYKRPFAE